MEFCCHCRFWYAALGNGLGECRQGAPQLGLDQNDPRKAVWPRTGEADWCGQFVPLPSPPDEPKRGKGKRVNLKVVRPGA